ncbi:MAG: hypothetical protein IKS34_04590, partial [Clostridia bacterium]|nr:hypothetical protein [Clostridia bacterium]
YFGIYGHPILNGEQVYDVTPAVRLKEGGPGTFDLQVFSVWAPEALKYSSWSTDQMSFRFYKVTGSGMTFLSGMRGLWRDELRRKMSEWRKAYGYTVEELTWDEIGIDEIRLYPLTLNVERWADPQKRTVQGESRLFDGTSAGDVIGKETYTAGTFDLPEFVWRGFDFSTVGYELTEAAVRRNALTVEYAVKGVNQVVKPRNSSLESSDVAAIVNDGDPFKLCTSVAVTPAVRGAYVGSVAVEDYDAGRGELRIGEKAFRNEDVVSDAWREGDGLLVYAYPSHGYKCDRIEITRADGTVEHTAPGGKVILSRGMSLKPLFYEEDIEVTVSWRYPGSFTAYQNRGTNMAGYAFAANHAFTDNGDGTFTFRNMIPGDIVTLYVVPENTDDTSVVIGPAVLEALPAGAHELTLTTDRGEEKIGLEVLAPDSGDAVPFDRFRVNAGTDAVWKKGSGEEITVVALSNAETVLSLMIDGKAVPEENYTAVKGFVRSRTGYWTRNAVEGEVRLNDDVRFVPCIGDAYAFEVDDHNMEFSFYLVDRAVEEGGALVRGRVVTKGGTIKRPSAVEITADNVDVAGIPVAGASVSVLSTEPGAKTTVNNVDYFTNATTDKNGCFTVYLPSCADNLGYCIAISMDDRIYQGVSVFTRNGTTVYVLPHQNRNFQIDRMTVGSDMDTTEIYVTDDIVKLGIHAVIAPGFRAQKLVLRSYDSSGAVFKEWTAAESPAEGWTYESAFVVSSNLA